MLTRFIGTSLAALSLLSGTFWPATEGSDWPSWRGSRGDGIQRDANPPVKWSPDSNITWRTAVPGRGRSSPIVVGMNVILTTGVEDDQSRRVLCFDTESGNLKWNTVVHNGPGGQMHRDNTTASSTPASDGERIFAAFVDDQGMTVAALSMNGELLWKKHPGTYFSNHGFAASPVLFEQGVIVNGHQDGTAFVVMLDQKTGDEVWRYTPEVHLRSFSTPVLTKYRDQDQLILTGASRTLALNPHTGTLIWSVEGPSDKFVCSPSVGHDMVFSFAGSPDKKALAVKLGGEGQVSESHVVWRSDRGMPYVPTPLLHGDYLHVISDGGVYQCIDAVTGKVQHTARALGSVYSSPVAVSDRIYLFEDSGRCTVIQNGPKFTVIAQNEVGEDTYCTPAISGDSLFVRTESNLLRIAEQKPNEP
ncbi:MAG: PQQ-binding-like beta-propeller repeat protein [Planctomyces sp.]|nr:PQQ-binding-like beta-propeller repeat protein [Planctomyces sp.]